MKLIFVGTSPNPRGTEQHMVTLALAVQRQGHEVHVLTQPGGFAWEALQGTAVARHAGRFRFPFDPRGLFPLWRLTRAVRPDWLVAGMAKEYYPTLLAGRAALFRHLDRPLNWFKRWVVSRFAARYFAVSAAVQRTLGMRDVIVLHNPIGRMTLSPEEERAARASHGIPLDARVVAYAGAFSESKGVFVLRDAISPLLHKYPNLHVLWLGSGKHEARLRASVGERHHFGSWQKEGRLVYAGVDILVVPSVARESASRVAAEAQLLGKVVCGSAVGGIPEMVCPQMRGFLTPGGDARALSATIDELVQTPLAELGAAGRRYVEAEFLDDRIAEKFLSALA